jgi:hypothetical protein
MTAREINRVTHELSDLFVNTEGVIKWREIMEARAALINRAEIVRSVQA